MVQHTRLILILILICVLHRMNEELAAKGRQELKGIEDELRAMEAQLDEEFGADSEEENSGK